MPLLHILILGLVQGITEFLPISSQGHLVLVREALEWSGWQNVPERTEGNRLILDVAVHVGTLFAVCVYFWRDVAHMSLGLGKLALGQRSPGARLALYVVVATVPLVIVGYFFKDSITAVRENLRLIAGTTMGFGLLLLVGDRLGMTVRRAEHMTAGSAILIGLAQVLALVPGTSRSGITMTAARFLGFERAEAARFSLLLAIPAIAGAGTLAGLDLYRMGDIQLGLDAVMAGALAFVVALAAIALMLRWLRHAGFTPFVVYRLILGAVLLIWLA